MDKLLNSILSAKLQELYLENKEWLSTILFMEDEMRFFKDLFNRVLSGNVEREDLQQIEMINSKLHVILERRKQLNTVLKLRKHQLEHLLEGNSIWIGLEVIEADASIKMEIKSLMAGERILKEELFKLVEQQKSNCKPIVTTRPLQVHAIQCFKIV